MMVIGGAISERLEIQDAWPASISVTVQLFMREAANISMKDSQQCAGYI